MITVTAKLREKEAGKLEVIKKQTGLTTSAILRMLVEAAQIVPAEINVSLSNKTENDVTTLAGSHVVFQS